MMTNGKLKNILKDSEKRWYLSITVSFIASLAFALYNGFLGIFKQSIWNGCISVYYILLLSARLIVLICEIKIKDKDAETKTTKRKKAFYITSIFLFLISLALIVPVSLMVLHQKKVDLDMIAGITVAAYTTYKVTIAIINYVKNKDNENLSVRQTRTINLIDAILSILTLQNTLILINYDGENQKLFILTAITSFIGIAIIIAVSIISLVRFVKENKKTKSEVTD